MFKFACGLLLGLLLIALPVNAQRDAPVEIHIQENNTVSVYECWWPGVAGTPELSPIEVYVTYTQGSIRYVCYLDDRFQIEPVEAVDHKDPRA